MRLKLQIMKETYAFIFVKYLALHYSLRRHFDTFNMITKYKNQTLNWVSNSLFIGIFLTLNCT